MKPVFVLTFLLISSISLSTCSFSHKNILKNLIHKQKNKLRLLQSSADPDNSEDPSTNGTFINPSKSSSGLSTGAICAIAIPCIAALVGVGAAAAILSGGAPAATVAPVVTTPVVTVPQPAIVDTSVAQLAVNQEIPVQPEIIQPKVELPPEPVKQIIRPAYPVNNVESPIINVPQQQVVVAQPQLVPVQQMQLVPVQQVEMVPVQKVEMVPVQQVVPTYQTAQVAPQITQISEVPKVTQVIQGGQGIQGGEFVTAPEGYGTSAIQGSTNPLNVGEFSSNNLM